MPEPLYAKTNCHPAYQLRWSLALFRKQPIPSSAQWLQALKTAVEPDGVRLLEHRAKPPNVELFLLSTQPDVSPPQVVKSVKGRLQYAVQAHAPRAFRRNFRLSSLGDANREAIENYVSRQLGHHRMADPRMDARLAEFQFDFPDVKLNVPQCSAHAQYSYYLHVVLIHAEREVHRGRVQITADMARRVAGTKSHRLSRLGLLGDHLHLTLGAPYHATPADVALAYMNNIAFAHGMTAVFPWSYYVGTFGEYDMDAVRS